MSDSKRFFFRGGNAPLLLLATALACIPLSNAFGQSALTYPALKFMKVLPPGFAGYSDDSGRAALMIDNGVIANRDKWAAAQTIFDGDSGSYDILIYALKEIDGESAYQFRVNGIASGPAFPNPSIASDPARDYELERHLGSNVILRKGDTLRVESNCVTNGSSLPKLGWIDYSRGRWTKLVLVPSGTPLPVAVIRHPVDTGVVAGATVAFRATAQGPEPLSYTWYRWGNPIPVGTGAQLQFTAAAADSGAKFECVVAGPGSKDTSRAAKLIVRKAGCTPVFAMDQDSLVSHEGLPVVLNARVACASGVLWTLMAGPGPRILDPEVSELRFNAPRIAHDTLLEYEFTARFDDSIRSKRVVVKLIEAIPDPDFSIPEMLYWPAAMKLAIRPELKNKGALDSSAYHPPLRFAWSLAGGYADTVQAGDSLVLSRPSQRDPVKVTLCLDNGGAITCKETLVGESPSGRAVRPNGLPGPFLRIQDGTLHWLRPGWVRIWDARGRQVWGKSGKAGESARLSQSAISALATGRMRFTLSP